MHFPGAPQIVRQQQEEESVCAQLRHPDWTVSDKSDRPPDDRRYTQRRRGNQHQPFVGRRIEPGPEREKNQCPKNQHVREWDDDRIHSETPRDAEPPSQLVGGRQCADNYH